MVAVTSGPFRHGTRPGTTPATIPGTTAIGTIPGTMVIMAGVCRGRGAGAIPTLTTRHGIIPATTITMAIIARTMAAAVTPFAVIATIIPVRVRHLPLPDAAPVEAVRPIRAARSVVAVPALLVARSVRGRATRWEHRPTRAAVRLRVARSDVLPAAPSVAGRQAAVARQHVQAAVAARRHVPAAAVRSDAHRVAPLAALRVAPVRVVARLEALRAVDVPVAARSDAGKLLCQAKCYSNKNVL